MRTSRHRRDYSHAARLRGGRSRRPLRSADRTRRTRRLDHRRRVAQTGNLLINAPFMTVADAAALGCGASVWGHAGSHRMGWIPPSCKGNCRQGDVLPVRAIAQRRLTASRPIAPSRESEALLLGGHPADGDVRSDLGLRRSDDGWGCQPRSSGPDDLSSGRPVCSGQTCGGSRSSWGRAPGRASRQAGGGPTLNWWSGIDPDDHHLVACARRGRGIGLHVMKRQSWSDDGPAGVWPKVSEARRESWHL